MHSPNGNIRIVLPLLGYHNIANALAASALAMSLKAPLSAIRSGLQTVKAIPGRLFPIYLSQHQLLIDDSYNSNFGSMKAAIDVLSKFSGYRVIVIGDMVELGKYSLFYHSEVGKIIRNSGINSVLTFGIFSIFINKQINFGKHFLSKDLIIDFLKKLLILHRKITILVKGSRSTKMEYIVKNLKEGYKK